MSTSNLRWTNDSAAWVTNSTTQRTSPPFANRSASAASPKGHSTSAASKPKNRLRAAAKRNSKSSFWSSCSSHLSHSLIGVGGDHGRRRESYQAADGRTKAVGEKRSTSRRRRLPTDRR